MVMPTNQKIDHFRGKTAARHLAEMRSSGISSSLEIHGAEAPGPFFAFLDAARETAVLFTASLLVLESFDFLWGQKVAFVVAFVVGWSFWKGARSSFLSWSRLQRVHRLVSEEQQEIEANRAQEREELMALYGEKGFSGDLLEKVVDVLMADQDRLLRVMLQEEMGLRLEEQSHPLIQGLCAAAGVVTSVVVLLPFSLGCSLQVLTVCAALFTACIGGLFAKLEKNDGISAFLWNGMLVAVTLVLVRTCMEIFG